MQMRRFFRFFARAMRRFMHVFDEFVREDGDQLAVVGWRTRRIARRVSATSSRRVELSPRVRSAEIRSRSTRPRLGAPRSERRRSREHRRHRRSE